MGMVQAGPCLGWLYVGKTFVLQCGGGSSVNRKMRSPQKNPKENKIEVREWEGNLIRSKVSFLEVNCSILLQN